MYGHDMLDGYKYYCYLPKSVDFSSYLVINPEVERIANIEILKQDLVSGGHWGLIMNIVENLMSC